MSPPVPTLASTSKSIKSELNVNEGSNDDNDDIVDDKDKRQIRSKVYDVEYAEPDMLSDDKDTDTFYNPNFDMDDPDTHPKKRGEPNDKGNPGNRGDSINTAEPISSNRCSGQKTQPMDCMTFKTRTTHSFLKSLISGLILGMAIHSNYDVIKPCDHPCVDVPQDLNPSQVNVEKLNLKELDKLQEIQELDSINETKDLDPDDHIWKCITVTRHKIQEIDEHDVHEKVEALWGDGKETWVQLNALCLQDPCPSIEYADNFLGRKRCKTRF